MELHSKWRNGNVIGMCVQSEKSKATNLSENRQWHWTCTKRREQHHWNSSLQTHRWNDLVRWEQQHHKHQLGRECHSSMSKKWRKHNKNANNRNLFWKRKEHLGRKGSCNNNKKLTEECHDEENGRQSKASSKAVSGWSFLLVLGRTMIRHDKIIWKRLLKNRKNTATVPTWSRVIRDHLWLCC